MTDATETPTEHVPLAETALARDVNFPSEIATWSQSTSCLRIDVQQPVAGGLDLSRVRARRVELLVTGNPIRALQTTAPRWSVALPDSTGELLVELQEGTQAGLDVNVPHKHLKVWVKGHRQHAPRLDFGSTPVHALEMQHVRVDLSGLLSNRLSISSLQLTDAELHVANRNINQLGVRGKCIVELNKTDVGVLTARGRAVLRVNTIDCRVGRVATQGDPGQPATGPALVLLQHSKLDIARASDLRVVINEHAELHLHEEASDISLTGPGGLHVVRAGKDFRFSEPCVRLTMAKYAQLLQATGPVILAEVAGASIVGIATNDTSKAVAGREPLQIREVSEEPDHSQGVTLIDVDVPVTLQGLRVLATLSDTAHQVTPVLHQKLPGLGPLSGLKVSAFRRAPDPRATSLLRAQYAHALSELAATTRAPASVRTKLAWCAYRMRNVVAPGRTERVLLSLYRTIGYGERVMPALGLYVALAVLMTGLALADRPIDLGLRGLATWVKGVLDWLVTPLHVLKLTQNRADSAYTFSQPWDTLARLMLAVPFATGVLALRKYVKEDAKR